MKPLRLSWLVIVVAVVVVNPDDAEASYGTGVKSEGMKGGGHGGKCRHRHKHLPDDRYWDKGASSGSGGSGGVAGAGEPWYMADDSHEAEELERDRKFREKTRSSEKQAPLVCFLRGDGFRQAGVMRFPMSTIPKDKCTHIVYSYLETDNKTGDVLFHKRGLRKEKAILRKLASMKNHNRHLKVLYSYGGGAHWSSLLNRLRSDKDMEVLVKKLDEVLREMRLDGINFHLEGPGPSTCSKKDADRVLQFIRVIPAKAIALLARLREA